MKLNLQKKAYVSIGIVDIILFKIIWMGLVFIALIETIFGKGNIFVSHPSPKHK